MDNRVEARAGHAKTPQRWTVAFAPRLLANLVLFLLFFCCFSGLDEQRRPLVSFTVDNRQPITRRRSYFSPPDRPVDISKVVFPVLVYFLSFFFFFVYIVRPMAAEMFPLISIEYLHLRASCIRLLVSG